MEALHGVESRTRRFTAEFDRILHRGPRRRRAMRILSAEYREQSAAHLVKTFDYVTEDSSAAIDAIGWPVIESGLLLFAEWKMKEGCDATFRLLSIPEKRFSETLGLVFTHLGARVLASIFAPSPALLLEVIGNSTASDASRAIALRAIPTLVARGDMAREETIPSIRKLFYDEKVLQSRVILEALFLSCIELHPSDFILDLLTVSNNTRAAPARGEKEVTNAWNRPFDSIHLIDGTDLSDVDSASKWLSPKKPSTRLRALFSYLEVMNPDWDHGFRFAVKWKQQVIPAIRRMLDGACDNPLNFARNVSPFPLVCGLCLAAEFKDLECGLHLVRILGAGYPIVDSLLSSDVHTIVPHILLNIFADKPEHLFRLAADSRAHLKGRMAAVVALGRLIRSGHIGDAEGLRMFEVILELGLIMPNPNRDLGELLLAECCQLHGADQSRVFTLCCRNQGFEQSSKVSALTPPLAPEEISAFSLMRLSRIHCGTPGASNRLKAWTSLMAARSAPVAASPASQCVEDGSDVLLAHGARSLD